MNPCDKYQQQLLHLIYGLVEDDERKELVSHLGACNDCRQALNQAEEHKKLLTTAARGDFSAVRFQPPQEGATPAVVPLKAGTPAASTQRRPVRWVRWALAASLLLAVVGSGLFAFVGWEQRRNALADAQLKSSEAQTAFRQIQDQRQNEQSRFHNEIQASQDEINKLVQQWQQAANQAERIRRDQGAEVVITGPRALQAGAQNQYRVKVKPRAPLKNMTAQVVNLETKQVLFKKAVRGQGDILLDLPRDLPIKPETELALEVIAEDGMGAPIQVSEKLLLVTAQFITHLTTDRPMYRPGETVRFRSLTLERFSLKPPKDDMQLSFVITAPNNSHIYKAEGLAQVLGPSQAIVKGIDGQTLRGLGVGQFQLPADLEGGEYTLTVSEAGHKFPPERRKFLVQQYQAPRLNKELQFNRSSYGPGETVEVQGKVMPAEGDVAKVANQPIKLMVNIDGREIPMPVDLRTDQQGQVKIRFPLPAQIERGVGTLSVAFTDGANLETIVRPIPIVVRKLLVDFFPEGGDLVAGLPNRVYFQVRTPLGKPADVRGRLVDQFGGTVAAVQTLQDDEQAGVNQGLGLFQFTPQAGQTYELKIDQPLGIQGRHLLPTAKPDGVVLTMLQGVVSDKIELTLRSGQRERQLLVGAYCRGRLLDNASVLARPGEAVPVTLRTMPGISGVYRVTVFENPNGDGSKLVPVAERLIYRQAVERLQFTVEGDKKEYQPGERVKLKLRSSNEKQAPAPAVLLVNVVDLSMLKLADDKTARTMPTHFLLTTEVHKPQDLENADFLLGDHPKAALTLDLLLGTQGWRRFAEQDPARFQEREPQEAQRLLAIAGQAAPQVNNLDKLAVDRIDQQYATRFVALQKNLAEKEKSADNLQTKLQAEERVRQTQANEVFHFCQQQRGDLDRYQQKVFQVGLAVLVFGLLVAAITLLVIGIIRLSHSHKPAGAYLICGLCLLGFLFLGSLLAITILGRGAAGRFDAVAKAVGVAPMARPFPADGQEEKKEEMNLLNQAVPVPEAAAAPGGPGMKGEVQLGDAKFAGRPPNMIVLGKLGVPPAKGRPRQEQEARKLMAKKQQDAAPGAPPAPGIFGGKPFRPDMNMDRDMLAPAEEPMPFLADRQWRQQGNFHMLVQNQLGRRAMLPALAEPFLVREFAHRHQPSTDEVRRDFTENLYWHPALVLVDGKGEVSFDLSDAVTRFQVQVMGHTLDGRLGASTFEVTSRLPFSVDAKIPMEINSNDKIAIPVVLANDTDKERQATIAVDARGLTLLDAAQRTLTLAGGKRARQLFHFQPAFVEGQARLLLSGHLASVGQDSLERSFKVVPEGFPIAAAHSDLLEGSATHTLNLPKEWIPNTLKCQVQVFPSTLADLQKGLEGLLREPCGCFEQSSSSNYPNVLILNYLQESDQGKPEMEKRTRQMLDRGYKQLTSFECLPPAQVKERRGYEWFGGAAPPHEALTAYGLLQFKDMARVFPVDQAMVERTRKYLLDQRDGQGGFKRNTRALDTFGRAPDHITNAYIVWALTEDGVKENLDAELKALTTQAQASKDPYFLALVGLCLVNSNRTDEGIKVLKSLAALQQAEGFLVGTQTSITGSVGRDLQIESTALAVLSWLKVNRPADFNTNVQKAVSWIGKQRGGFGGFGATQSTILALKALIAHTRESKRPAEAGELRLFVNDQPEPVGVLAFPAQSAEPLILGITDPKVLRPGQNKVRVEMTGKNSFPFTLSWSYQTRTPPSADKCPVRLEAKLSKPSVQEGETVRLTAVVENTSGKGQGMAVAIIGLPGGLTLPEDMQQLKNLARLRDNDTKPGLISHWEIRGRELVLYWRDLAPQAKIQVEIDLICRIPGEYRGPASRAYLYYNADVKHWIEPLAINIEPKAE